MIDINFITLLLVLIVCAACTITGWLLFLHRDTTLTPFSRFFVIFFIIALLALLLTCIKIFTSDTLIVRDFVSIFSSGGIACTLKWPEGINLTKDEKKRIGRRVREARSRANKDSQSFDLTPYFIAQLFQKQDGRCYFTKKQMTWAGYDLDTASISRVDPKGNYTQDNVVLCSLIIANMRNSYSYQTTLIYSKAIINNVLSLDDARLSNGQAKDRHLISRQQPSSSGPIGNGEKTDGNKRAKNMRKPRCKNKYSLEEREEAREFAAIYSLKKCLACGEYLTLDCFYIRTKNNPGPDGLEARCKDCERTRAMEQSLGVIGLFKEKVTGAKIRSKKKGQTSDLTHEIALAQLNAQGGLCYYTGIPMTGEPGNLDNVSIDRIDSTKPYIEGNVVICCEAINIMKNEMSYKDFVVYCRAIVDNSLPLDDPRLLTRPNESIGGKLRAEALDRKPEFGGIRIERHGLGGFSAGGPLTKVESP